MKLSEEIYGIASGVKSVDYGYLYKRVVELEKQIERMKCCKNCKHITDVASALSVMPSVEPDTCYDGDTYCFDSGYRNWEMIDA